MSLCNNPIDLKLLDIKGAAQRREFGHNIREATINFWKEITDVDTSGKYYKLGITNEETLKYYDEFTCYFEGYWNEHHRIMGTKFKEE
jgi:hypothetical protein